MLDGFDVFVLNRIIIVTLKQFLDGVSEHVLCTTQVRLQVFFYREYCRIVYQSLHLHPMPMKAGHICKSVCSIILRQMLFYRLYNWQCLYSRLQLCLLYHSVINIPTINSPPPQFFTARVLLINKLTSIPFAF